MASKKLFHKKHLLQRILLYKKYLKYFLEGYIFHGNKYMLKVNNRSTKRTYEKICLKLIKKTPEKRQGCRSYEYLPLPLNISHTFFLVISLLV